MRNQEAHELLRKWKEEGDLASRDKVVLAHMKTAERWVGKYTIPSWCGITADDAVQLAYEGVLIACDKYRLDHPTPNFYACVVSYIRRQLSKAMQERWSRKGIKDAEQSMLSILESETTSGLDAPKNTNCQYGWSSLDPGEFLGDVVASGMADMVRRTARTHLTSRELAVYRLHFEMGYTYERTGSELGIGRQRAAKIGRDARKKIRNILEGEF